MNSSPMHPVPFSICLLLGAVITAGLVLVAQLHFRLPPLQPGAMNDQHERMIASCLLTPEPTAHDYNRQAKTTHPHPLRIASAPQDRSRPE